MTAQERYDHAVRPERPVQRVKWLVTTVIVVALAWSVITTEIRWQRLLGAPEDIGRIFWLMFSDLAWDRLGDFLLLMWESISMAWLGTMLASLVAVPLSFLAAENLAGRVTVTITRQVFNILRAVPEIIIAIALVPIFGLTPMTGTLAIAIGSIGTLGKLNAEIVETIDSGPIEAADAVGASSVQRLRWSVIPQALPEVAAFALYRFEINIRVSAVLGLVGAGGIGSALAQYVSYRRWGAAGLALVIVVLATIAVDTISGAVRRRIISGPRSDAGGEVSDVEPSVAETPI